MKPYHKLILGTALMTGGLYSFPRKPVERTPHEQHIAATQSKLDSTRNYLYYEREIIYAAMQQPAQRRTDSTFDRQMHAIAKVYEADIKTKDSLEAQLATPEARAAAKHMSQQNNTQLFRGIAGLYLLSLGIAGVATGISGTIQNYTRKKA